MKRGFLLLLAGCTDIYGLTRGTPLPEEAGAGELPVMAVATNVHAQSLAVNGDDVFWVAGKRASTAKITGGLPRDLPQEVTTAGIAVDDRYVYGGNDYRVWAQPKDGTGTDASKVIVQQTGLPRFFAADETHVFWTNAESGSNTIIAADKASTGTLWKIVQVTQSSTTSQPIAIATTGDRVVWIEVDASRTGRVLSAPKNAMGTKPTVIVDSLAAPSALAGDADGIAWAAGGSVTYASSSAGAARVVGHDLGASIAVALDATHVYWTNPAAQRVERALRAGGEIEVVADRQVGLTAISLGNTDVVWATTDSIARRSKR